MQVEARIAIQNNPNLKRYLKEHSLWYKYLNRSPKYLKQMEEVMKKEYKLTTEDRIEKIGESINLVSSLLSVLKYFVIIIKGYLIFLFVKSLDFYVK